MAQKQIAPTTQIIRTPIKTESIATPLCWYGNELQRLRPTISHSRQVVVRNSLDHDLVPWSRWLLTFERVFEAADGVLNLALYLVGLALRLQLGVTDGLADHLLDCAFDLLRRSPCP